MQKGQGQASQIDTNPSSHKKIIFEKIEKCKKNRNDHETLAIMVKEERTPETNNQHSKNEFLKLYLK